MHPIVRVVDWVGMWACGCFLVACDGESHRLGGESDGGMPEGGLGGTTSSTGGQSASGGTASGGGAPSAGASFGGVGSVNGTGGTGAPGGTGGSGIPTDCQQPLDLESFDCDVAGFMRTHCARGGCHNAATSANGLDLTLDSLFVARLLDVPARLVTNKPGFGACIDSKCPPLGSTRLIDSRAPEQSWMLKKTAAFDFARPTTAPDMGCGTAMPYPPGGTGYTPERDACLTSFVLSIAENGVACALPSEPPPEVPTCPDE